MREPEATKLFIGQVPNDWTIKQLREVLEKFGEIYSLNLLTDFSTGQHKGCAFVTYYDNESAKAAQEELHGKRTLPGARFPMKVQPAESETLEEYRKLFVGMLSRSLDDSDLRDMFSSFGTIQDANILRSPDGKSKGCGFVRYETRLQAQNAIKCMHNSQIMEGCSKSIVVRLADSEKNKVNKLRVQSSVSNIPGIGSAANAFAAISPAQQTAYYQQLMAMPHIISNPTLASAPAIPGTIGALVAAMASQQQQLQQQQVQPSTSTSQNSTNSSNYGSGVRSVLHNYNTGAQKLPSVRREGPDGANLFIYQIPSEFSDRDLMQTFMPFGNVVSSKVFVDKNTGISKGFGFVSFDSASNANAAINAMNGFVISGKKLKVEVKRSKDRSKPY